MKKNMLWLLLIVTGLFLVLFPGCIGTPVNPSPSPTATSTPITTPTPTPAITYIPSPDPGTNIVHITTNVTVNTIWPGNYVYVVDDTFLEIKAVLTIQPGAVIKIKAGGSIVTTTTGSIIADGNDTAHIIFTSIKDDTRGGDTNGDGGATTPGKGDWPKINISVAGCTFDYCEFYYGGDGGYDTSVMLEINTDTAVVTNCTFAHSEHAAIYAKGDAGTITMTGNTFYDNIKPVWMHPNNNFDNTNVFHNPGNASEGNVYNGIWIQASATTNVDVAWGETEVPYVLTGSAVVNAELTLQPGVIIKFSPGTSMSGSGALIAVGNSGSHITFTSLADDTNGGDTDNAVDTPAKGDWGKIFLSEDGSNLTYCDLFYGGAGNYDYSAMLELSTTAVTIDHCTLAHSEHAAMNLCGATSETSVVTNNVIYDTTMPIWMSPDFSIDGSNTFYNPANPTETNAKNGIWLEGSQSVRANRTWGETEVPYVCPVFGITATFSLTIAPTAVLKFTAGGRLDIGTSASVVNFANVTFTSFKDDTLGDTNGDGATSPAEGDWTGIWDINYEPNSHYLQDGNILFDLKSPPT